MLPPTVTGVTDTPHTRPATAMDALAEQHLDEQAELDPIMAAIGGINGYDDALPALDPDWHEQRSRMRRHTLADLAETPAADATDRVTAAALIEQLTLAEQLRATGAEESALNSVESPLQQIRDVFDLSPVESVQNWADVATRLAAVPDAVAGYMASLRLAASQGHVSARRQVLRGVDLCGDNIGPSGFFARFAAAAAPTDGSALPESLFGDLGRGARAAADAYAGLQEFLREELLAQAPARDAIGRDLYPLYSQSFLGAQIDLAETYEWGQQELARITAEMAATALRIRPGASVAQAIAELDHDPARMLSGTAALQAWMQQTSDAAVAALAGTHFDIPDPIRTLECRIAPTELGGIYYTGPTEDLVTRPGRMWWSVPKGVTEFATWRERTTVYHEGVPGHHLQIGQTTFRRSTLNRWRRLGMWISGHGEGWALYAERLMAELGFLDDPADYLGMLEGQSLRAARVVLDIGIHCEFDAPAEVGGGPWTYDKAWDFLAAHASISEGMRRFELDRYLGWPGQAPAYKVGERLWLRLRADARAAAGDEFDLTVFHRRALDVGSLGLDLLRATVLDQV